MGRRQFRVRLADDPSGRPGKVIVCQLLGVFQDGFKGPTRITITAQELRGGEHRPLISLSNDDFDPAIPDVIREYPDGSCFGFLQWTDVGSINLNDFQGYGTGDVEIEVTCRGFELRDEKPGNQLFEETRVCQAVLVTDGYFARKQRWVDQLKAVVIAMRLFMHLDGGAISITTALNRHYDAFGAGFKKRWIRRDVQLLHLIQPEFTRHLPSRKTPCDVAEEAGLALAPKELREWLIAEVERMLDYKPAGGQAVQQAIALKELLGGS
jgi:hypothetical protein